MALDKSKLRGKLAAHFSAPTKDFGLAAERLATAYVEYMKDATSCLGGHPNPATLAAKKKTLVKMLTGIFATGKSAATFSAVAVAFSNYWLLPAPVVFIGGPTPGATIAAVPASLGALFAAAGAINSARAASRIKQPADAVAEQWANALHTWTKTSVIVAHTAPPSPCTSPVL